MPDKPNILIPILNEPAIRNALKAIRQAEPLGDSPFRRLAWIHEKLDRHGPPATRMAFDIAVADALTECIESNLLRLRSIQGITRTDEADREEAVAAMARDFSSGNTELEAWSALYYRYVRVDLDLQAQAMAHLIGADPRQLRRRFQHGFHRLSEEISRRESAARAANWKNWLTLKLPHQVSGPLVGIEAVVERAIKQMSDPAAPRITAVVGPGGIGKSALAASIARRVIDSGDFEDIAWIALESVTDYGTLISLIANEVGFSLAGLEHAEIEGNVRVRLSSQRTLIVIDNADQVSDPAAVLNGLDSLIGAGRALWISPQRPPSESAVALITVSPLAEDDTIKLVSEIVRLRHKSEDGPEPDVIAAIAQASGGNPLAARVLASQIAYLPVERVLETIGSLRTSGGEDLFDALFARAWGAISGEDQQAAIALAILPPGGAVWADWQEIGGLNPSEMDQAVRGLIDASLVEMSSDGDRYWMQPLARRFVAEQARNSPWRDQVEQALVEKDNGNGDDGDGDAQPERSLSALRQWVAMGETPRDLAGLIDRVAPAARRSGHWAMWRELLRSARENVADIDSLKPAMTRIKLELGVAYRWLGEMNAAQVSLEEAIAESGEVGDFSLQAKALVEIGLLHESAGRLEQAEEAYRRAANAGERYKDAETQRRALIGLAGLAVTSGRPEIALKLAGEAMATFGDEPPDGQAMSMLGHIYHQLGDSTRAVEIGEKALELLIDEGDIPRQSRAHMRLGMAYHSDGQPDKALIHLGQGMGLMKALGDALGQARILTNLGAVYSAGSRFDEALSAWRDAISLQEQLGDRVGMAYTWANLADLQWKMDQREAARDSLKIARGLAEERGLVSLLANLDVHPSSQP